MIEIEEDNDDFLCQVAEAEARALSNKRRISSIDPNSEEYEKKKKQKEEVNEGVYMAALRGSNSLRWQKFSNANSSTGSKVKPFAPHPQYNNLSNGADFDGIPEKNCPCGLGRCVVLTANTERNQGRKFYKCPVRQENGGCGFFEWCDSGNRNNVPNLPCPCGAGSCLILTAKTGKNVGQQFYRCPANQASSCGFFKWCNDNVLATAGHAAGAFNSMNELSNKSNVIRTGSSCFKCGNEGHWAKDCTISSESRMPADSWARTAASRSPAYPGARTAASVSITCHKCGKPGHQARNCTSTQYMNVSWK